MAIQTCSVCPWESRRVAYYWRMARDGAGDLGPDWACYLHRWPSDSALEDWWEDAGTGERWILRDGRPHRIEDPPLMVGSPPAEGRARG